MSTQKNKFCMSHLSLQIVTGEKIEHLQPNLFYLKHANKPAYCFCR